MNRWIGNPGRATRHTVRICVNTCIYPHPAKIYDPVHHICWLRTIIKTVPVSTVCPFIHFIVDINKYPYFLPLGKEIGTKVSWIGGLLSRTNDIIWSQRLCSSRVSSAVIHWVSPPAYCIKSLIKLCNKDIYKSLIGQLAELGGCWTQSLCESLNKCAEWFTVEVWNWARLTWPSVWIYCLLC